jgi:hypothetical protein
LLWDWQVCGRGRERDLEVWPSDWVDAGAGSHGETRQGREFWGRSLISVWNVERLRVSRDIQKSVGSNSQKIGSWSSEVTFPGSRWMTPQRRNPWGKEICEGLVKSRGALGTSGEPREAPGGTQQSDSLNP